MDEKNLEILAERRAKIARLRGELSVQERDITSAPSLTVVDEFHENFSAADKRSGAIETGKDGEEGEHKIFYANGSNKKGRKVSDLEYNNLVNEARKRGGGSEGNGGGENKSSTNDFESFSTMAEDDYIDEDGEFSTVNQIGEQRDLFNQFQGEGNINLSSSITRVYQNGKYMSSNEDLGYQSSASSPNEAKRKPVSTISNPRLEKGLLKVEKGVDTFSQSLPETFLKSVKQDLSQSVNGGGRDKSRSKVVYDPRIFGVSGPKPSQNEDDVEKEYFDRMNKLHGKGKDEGRNSFRQFLDASFRDRSEQERSIPERVSFFICIKISSASQTVIAFMRPSASRPSVIYYSMSERNKLFNDRI